MKTNKKVLYWAIGYCAIIGIIYVTLSVLALYTRWCKLDQKASTFIYMLYLQFFRVDKCDPSIDWEFLNGNEVEVNVVWSPETAAVQRTYIFTMAYLALHTALVFVSIIAFFGIIVSYVGRKSFILFIAPWISILIAIIVLDALATVYYIIDSLSVWKVEDLMDFLEIFASDKVRADILANFREIPFFSRVGPPIIMALATSKIFIFWVFNIYVCVLITKYGWSLACENDEEDRKNYQNAIIANDNPAFEDESSHKTQIQINPLSRPKEISQQLITQEVPENNIAQQIAAVEPSSEQRYHDTSRSIDYVYPHQIYAKSNKQKEMPEEEQVNFRIQRPKLEVQRASNSHSPNLAPSYKSHLDNEIENRLSRFQASNGNLFAYENVPRNSNRENPYASINVHQKEVKVRPNPPPKPLNNQNKFYLQSTGHEEQPVQYRTDNRSNDVKVDRSSNLKAPEVLKSQLPWSYFKSSENAPRRTLMYDEHPELPQPDYNHNSPIKKRRNYSGSEDESWKYQRY
ncbi:hypothetical protein PVAND_008317 [Polypedilum vanderplanki]|uniref:Uncharacterized protein n=1 Tax=Polypedilum vanderplanki TaxID=319348 RepID=A0A9J6CAN0_POLVA|nr:hypothetical protein PVAND_008317 [Polypedilum vanderplanki]